jgi:hypothetical protein
VKIAILMGSGTDLLAVTETDVVATLDTHRERLQR